MVEKDKREMQKEEGVLFDIASDSIKVLMEEKGEERKIDLQYPTSPRGMIRCASSPLM